ncbi:MAG: hypothetical protein HZB35_06155 [Nitrospirae bacterium]|nr:hypothetical protein [Nitrospirota bacterium]
MSIGQTAVYTTTMKNVVWMGAGLGGLLLVVLGRWIWRRRRAAKLADALLAEIVKGKDAFRR